MGNVDASGASGRNHEQSLDGTAILPALKEFPSVKTDDAVALFNELTVALDRILSSGNDVFGQTEVIAGSVDKPPKTLTDILSNSKARLSFLKNEMNAELRLELGIILSPSHTEKIAQKMLRIARNQGGFRVDSETSVRTDVNTTYPVTKTILESSVVRNLAQRIKLGRFFDGSQQLDAEIAKRERSPLTITLCANVNQKKAVEAMERVAVAIKKNTPDPYTFSNEPRDAARAAQAEAPRQEEESEVPPPSKPTATVPVVPAKAITGTLEERKQAALAKARGSRPTPPSTDGQGQAR